jgi:hypothetical protein
LIFWWKRSKICDFSKKSQISSSLLSSSQAIASEKGQRLLKLHSLIPLARIRIVVMLGVKARGE